MRFTVFALMLGAATSPLFAAEKLQFGPPPSWVVPIPLPLTVKSAADAPVSMMLADQQISFQDGRLTSYNGMALKLLTAQGLAAGNIAFSWSPESDTVTVNKLHILRGKETIDVLASGQTFTIVRREGNLESATLDGVLTASLTPEGLQVGDIVQLGLTVVRHDPLMKGHVETIAATWNGVPISRAHLRAQWPSTLKVQFRPSSDLEKASVVTRGGLTVLELNQVNIEPLIVPKGAPARFSQGRSLDLTDFASWQEVATLLSPLYVEASKIPATGPLRDEVEKIRKSAVGPKAQAEAALAMVQDRVRYVALLMGQAGYAPAAAGETWSRRFGDCKGKTALLLGILRELGIKAEPVLVNAGGDERLNERAPMLGLFNHILVRAQVDGRDYWLDGTRTGDTSLARLEIPNFGWGLPLAPSASLVRMQSGPAARPLMEIAIRTDASAGITLPAPTHAETVMRGDAASAVNAMLAGMSAAQRDEMTRTYWKGAVDDLSVTSTSVAFDKASGELRFVADGTLAMDWDNGSYEPEGSDIGYKPDFERPAGAMQQVPFVVAYPSFARVSQRIVLPAGFGGEAKKPIPELKETLAGVEYHRQASLEKDVFNVTTSMRSIAREISYKEALAAAPRLEELSDEALQIRIPPWYRKSSAEIEKVLTKKPSSAAGFVTRGNQLLDAERYLEAETDFSEAVKLDPDNVYAWADRAIARSYLNQYEEAADDLKKVAALKPDLPLLFRARGILALAKSETKDAVTAFTQALAADPQDNFSRSRRAQANAALKHDDEALADAAQVLKSFGNWIDMRSLRASIFKRRGDMAAVIAEADAIMALQPNAGYPLVLAANIYSAGGARDQADKAFARALSIKPESFVYLNRAQQRPTADKAGKMADLNSALKLTPKDIFVLASKAGLLARSGDRQGALTLYNSAIANDSSATWLLTERGILLHKLNRSAEAARDFAAVRAKASTAADFNNLCYPRVLNGVDVEAALADCNQAIRREPDNAAYLDSRALAFLRLGRLDEALADYDKALKDGTDANILYGRALVWARKGDKQKAQTDRVAALKDDPDIALMFSEYGLRPQEQ